MMLNLTVILAVHSAMLAQSVNEANLIVDGVRDARARWKSGRLKISAEHNSATRIGARGNRIRIQHTIAFQDDVYFTRVSQWTPGLQGHLLAPDESPEMFDLNNPMVVVTLRTRGVLVDELNESALLIRGADAAMFKFGNSQIVVGDRVTYTDHVLYVDPRLLGLIYVTTAVREAAGFDEAFRRIIPAQDWRIESRNDRDITIITDGTNGDVNWYRRLTVRPDWDFAVLRLQHGQEMKAHRSEQVIVSEYSQFGDSYFPTRVERSSFVNDEPTRSDLFVVEVAELNVPLSPNELDYAAMNAPDGTTVVDTRNKSVLGIMRRGVMSPPPEPTQTTALTATTVVSSGGKMSAALIWVGAAVIILGFGLVIYRNRVAV